MNWLNRCRTMTAALLLLFAQGSAWALAPEDGVWWNPSQSGRGWFIVSQNHIMVVASYTYAANGDPVWYLSVGEYNASTRRYSSTLDLSRNGQCIGCPYRAPVPGAGGGALAIQFDGDERGTLTQNGEVVPIQKFYFAYGSEQDRLYGEWAYACNVGLGIGDAEFFNFVAPPGGGSIVDFRRRFSSSGTGLASYVPSAGVYVALLDSSTSFWKAYQFRMGANRIIDGRWWLYRKGTDRTGAGEVMHGVRVRDRVEVPTFAKSDLDAMRLQEERDEALFLMQSKSEAAEDLPGVAEALAELERILNERGSDSAVD